jgi:hypothetical protein
MQIPTPMLGVVALNLETVRMTICNVAGCRNRLARFDQLK